MTPQPIHIFASKHENKKQTIKRQFLPLFAIILPLLFISTSTASAKSIGLFVGNTDSYTCLRALEQRELPGVDIRIFTDKDMDGPDFPLFMKKADVAVVDIMQHQPAEWLLEHRDQMNPDARIYAVRGSSHTQDFIDAGFKMDRSVRAYYKYTSADNISRMLRFLTHRDLGIATEWNPPVSPPENALYHPDAPKLFASSAEYEKWYRESGRFHEGSLWNLTVIFPTFTLDG